MYFYSENDLKETKQRITTSIHTPLVMKLPWLPISEHIKNIVPCVCYTTITTTGATFHLILSLLPRQPSFLSRLL